MRELFADFNRLDEKPGLGQYIALGRESQNAELRGLREGERVHLKEPNELQAEATVASRIVRGDRWWLGVLVGEIEVIYHQPSMATADQ